MLKGKRIVITGASAGLGAELAKESAALGAHLMLAARRVSLLDQLRSELLDNYPESKIYVHETDVSKQSSVSDLVSASAEYLGGIDIFIANAGQSMWSRFRDLKNPDELDTLMKLNYMGVVYSAFFALPYLCKSKGSFVAISSLQGSLPVPYHTGYVASKHAVNGFLESLALEEPDVHIMLAMPAWIAGTELRSHALMGSAEGSVAVKHSHSANTMTAKECARTVLEALAARKSCVFMPKIYQLVPFLRLICKRAVDAIVKNKVAKQLGSGRA